MSREVERVGVLFVCLGNICRSPTAEALFIHHVRAAGLDHHFDIDSAGTGDWHVGDLADPRTRAAAARRGIEILSRARQFERADFDRFAHILVMDRHNRRNVVARVRTPDDAARVELFRSFDPDPDHDDVPDPYEGGPEAFELVLDNWDRTALGLRAALRERHGIA